jgi:hypothetical protein
MNSLEIEKKYIEERVKVLRELQRRWDKEILEAASKAKKELMARRIREEYGDKLPVDLDTFFHIIFEEFEGINRIINYTVLEKSKTKLRVRIDRCWYAEIYRSLGAQDIGEAMVCQMDPTMNKALNPKIKFSRQKMLMKGDDCCLFEYFLANE